MANTYDTSTVILSTSIVAFISGFMLGVYSIRGYLISPELAEERRRNFGDPVESDEDDVDEDDTILDHAPNWVNGEDADRRDGLRAVNQGKNKNNGGAQKGKDNKPGEGTLVDIGENTASTPGGIPNLNPNEECKLVLVVRTDLGMTKGTLYPHLVVVHSSSLFSCLGIETNSPNSRQDSSPVLPRHPGLLQDALSPRADLPRGPAPPTLGAHRPGQDRGSNQVGTGAVGAHGQGAQPGLDGRSHPGRRADADRCREQDGARCGTGTQESGGPSHWRA